ncbi:alpha-ketoglutarate-dependent dioxygenase AlkB family protein [Amycolatopsis benzoatilytica]|uniref:alpha-ketoglutarate-dependent dioxygenase AlkB family protein n=1 Tax=Amycolatopsis benzoatilytica TaxID=346045 RepID=UPI0004893E90|nr:alpha-ketoglutarate-dependent dioxygenase AlkB [Amycolatopsis benzoatilytica]
MMELLPRPRREISPGAVHLPEWLGRQEQLDLIAACRGWRGYRSTKLPGGGVMSVRTVCLGWQWLPYCYSRTREDGSPVEPFPHWLAELGRRALADAYERPAEDYRPDVALVNYYDAAAKMGMHQDKDENSTEPVVSLSLGDACVFRFGNTENRNRPYTDVELRSGDLFVFGGPARLAYHGVPKTLPGTADPDLGLTGRLNLTLRVSGR